MAVELNESTATSIPARAWAQALSLVGTPFRLHGRMTPHDPAGASGLDCVGLILGAYQRAGHSMAGVPRAYALRDHDPAAVEALIADASLCRAKGCAVLADGDVLLADMGRGQLHLMIGGYRGCAPAIVHAHAGLRRVVVMPLPAGEGGAARLLSRWRLPAPASALSHGPIHSPAKA